MTRALLAAPAALPSAASATPAVFNPQTIQQALIDATAPRRFYRP